MKRKPRKKFLMFQETETIKKLLIFRETEPFSPCPKKYLIIYLYFRKQNFLIFLILHFLYFLKRKLFLYFLKNSPPYFLASALKNFPKNPALKKCLIFSQESSHFFRNGNLEKKSLYFRKQNFLIFREVTFQDQIFSIIFLVVFSFIFLIIYNI